MKNKLLVLVLIGIIVLTGCGKKEITRKDEVKGPRVICTSIDEMDGIRTATTVILKFNSDKYVNYQLLESIMTFKEKETFDSYAEAIKESGNTIELGEGVEYDYSINDKKKQITTTMIYNESVFDYSNATDVEKNSLTASAIIESTEDSGSTCKFIETTRNALGLK